MKQSRFIIEIIREKYGEYLDRAGADAPALLADMLACTLWREINEKEYYKKQLDELRQVKHER